MLMILVFYFCQFESLWNLRNTVLMLNVHFGGLYHNYQSPVHPREGFIKAG